MSFEQLYITMAVGCTVTLVVVLLLTGVDGKRRSKVRAAPTHAYARTASHRGGTQLARRPSRGRLPATGRAGSSARSARRARARSGIPIIGPTASCAASLTRATPPSMRTTSSSPVRSTRRAVGSTRRASPRSDPIGCVSSASAADGEAEGGRAEARCARELARAVAERNERARKQRCTTTSAHVVSSAPTPAGGVGRAADGREGREEAPHPKIHIETLAVPESQGSSGTGFPARSTSTIAATGCPRFVRSTASSLETTSKPLACAAACR